MDPNSPTPVSPEPQVTPAAPVVPGAPSAPVAAPSARESIYRQYYGGDPAAAPAAPSTPPAPGGPPVAEPAPAAPVAAEPVAPTPPPEPAPDLGALIESKISAAMAAMQKPVAPVAPSALPEPQADWLTLLSEGKKTEAEKALARVITQELNVDRIREEAVTQALELSKVQATIDGFLTDLRGKNPDLVPLEKLIAIEAEQKFQTAANAGRIRSSADYVEQYKSAVLTATEEVRKIAQQLRDAGKQAAMTLRSEVVSAQPLTPNPIANAPAAPAAPAAPEDLSSYLRRRMATANVTRGLAQ